MRIPTLSPFLSTRAQQLWLLLQGVSVLLLAGSWYAAQQLFPAESPATVLHYSIEVGIDFVGAGSEIRTLPLIGSALLVFNLILGSALLRADTRAAWVLWTTTPTLQAILLAAVLLLWRINVA